MKSSPWKGKVFPYAIFYVMFTALLFAMHLPYLKLPFHWDELGQFVPAALDLYRDGSWIAHSTLPNVHPPAVMALLALVWHIAGYSILSARVAMLAIASVGVFLSFLLAIRLGRGVPGAPAFAAGLFLLLSPLFYTQSMMVLLDMPAMMLTIGALLLFLDGRWAWCAAVCTALVLTKETALSTPLVFGAWLWFRDGKRREARYFLAPAAALGAWLVMLHHATGHWLGNAEFAEYNVAGALRPLSIVYAVVERFVFLFVRDGHFIGAIALYVGWRLLRGRDWGIAALVAGAQIFVVTVLGGAVLDRYLLPVLPILFIAFATAASAYPASWRWTSHTVFVILLVAGWFIRPVFQYEDNLSMTDFVELQRSAADFLETSGTDKRIASMWPFTDAIRNPDFGYVDQPLHPVEIPSFDVKRIAALDPARFDVLVVYSRQYPLEGSWMDAGPLHSLLRLFPNYHPQATRDEMEAHGFLPLVRWDLRGQWIEVYTPEHVR